MYFHGSREIHLDLSTSDLSNLLNDTEYQLKHPDDTDKRSFVFKDEIRTKLVSFAGQIRQFITEQSYPFAEAKQIVFWQIGEGYIAPRWKLVPENAREKLEKSFGPKSEAQTNHFTASYLTNLSDLHHAAKISDEPEDMHATIDTLISAAGNGARERLLVFSDTKLAEQAEKYLQERSCQAELKARKDKKVNLLVKWE